MKACTNCGTKNRNDANHCSKCGNSSFGSSSDDNGIDNRRFHFFYFLIIGCWLWAFPAAFVLPLFTSGGRRFIAKCAGYW